MEPLMFENYFHACLCFGKHEGFMCGFFVFCFQAQITHILCQTGTGTSEWHNLFFLLSGQAMLKAFFFCLHLS